MTSQASQFVGSIPENYDKGLGPHIFHGYANDLAQRVAALSPVRVLELAAGTGIVTRRLRDALDEGCRLTASDLNGPMLDVAKEKFENGELVDFQVIDAMDISHGDENFDAVVCQFGVMFFPDKARSFAEVHRVLKPAGHYIFSCWDSWTENPFAELAHTVVMEFFPEDPPGFYKVPFSYYDSEEIEETVLGAGFDQVEIEHVALTSPIPSPELFAKGVVFGNPLFDEIISRNGDANAVQERMTVAIAEQLGKQMPLKALVVHARK
ncbi:MAG: class I SAM-dependent methyltransferase [Hyphomicrobiales bacterium]